LNNRADIEAAFAEAEAELARVVAILAKANSDYVEAEFGIPTAKSGRDQIRADIAKAEEDLAKARASCISARDRLTKLNFAEGRPKNYLSGWARAMPGSAAETEHTEERDAGEYRDDAGASGTGAYVAGLVAGPDGHKAAAEQRSALSGAAEPYLAQVAADMDDTVEIPVKGRGNSAGSGTVPEPAVLSTGPGSKRASSARDPRGWRTLGWQTAQLSILTLAYLQYYFIDVNLQIAMLPSPVFPGLVGG